MNDEIKKITVNLSQNAAEYPETVSNYSSSPKECSTDFETLKSLASSTSASGMPSSYPHTLPKDYEIIKEVLSGLSSLKDEHARYMTSRLLLAFQLAIRNNRNTIEKSGYLPPLIFRPLDDDSALIEWIFKDFRIGFAIEPAGHESGWYFVSNQNLTETEESKSGPLNLENLNVLLNNIFRLVLSNT